MRRGRPTKIQGDQKNPKPSPSPAGRAGSDPWASLDPSAPSHGLEPGSLDDASIRFPALDDFALLHDSGGKFAFDPTREPKKEPAKDISQRVTEALADDAFAQPKSTSERSGQHEPSLHVRKAPLDPQPRHQTVETADPQKASRIATTEKPSSEKPTMVSIGTLTSPWPPSPPLQNATTRPIFRFPPSSSDHRSSSQPRSSDASAAAAVDLRADGPGTKRPAFLEHRSRSQILTPESSRFASPSLEVRDHRSSYLGGLDNTVQRSKSANSKGRPSSLQGTSKPNIVRRMSSQKARPEGSDDQILHTPLITAVTGDADGDEAIKIDSNVDFLKVMEEEEASKRKEKRLSSGSRHIKRASMPSVSLSGTKNLLTGRFGDAFKKFESNATGSDHRNTNHSPDRGANDLTPIAGSEATDGRSDDGNDLEESEEIPPEMRRELERRRLSQEEKRVADAAAAYRQRLEHGGEGARGRPGSANNKAFSIQSKVMTLLDESGRASPSPTKTASGYGRFTDSPAPPMEQQALVTRQSSRQDQQHPPRTTSRQVLPSNDSNSQRPIQHPSPQAKPFMQAAPHTLTTANTSSRLNPSANPSTSPPTPQPPKNAPPTDRPSNRPPPKPSTKPQILRTGDNKPPQSPAKPSNLVSRKPLPQRSDLVDGSNDTGHDDWESQFSKKYPDLAGLEMVETEVNGGGGKKDLKFRDV